MDTYGYSSLFTPLFSLLRTVTSVSVKAIPSHLWPPVCLCTRRGTDSIDLLLLLHLLPQF